MRKLFCSLFFPDFPLEILSHRESRTSLAPEKEVIIVTEEESEVFMSSSACKLKGIIPGTPVSIAKILSTDISLYRREPLLERKYLKKIGQWALQFSPVVEEEMLSPKEEKEYKSTLFYYYGITLDMTGCERLYKEKEIYCLIQEKISRAGIKVKVGVALTKGGAWAAARFGSSSPYIEPFERDFNQFPLSALRLKDGSLNALSSFGITTIGELQSLPIRSLRKRFGEEVYSRLMQLKGEKRENLNKILSRSSSVRSSLVFDSPLQSKSQVFSALEKVMSLLMQTLKQTQQESRHFTLLLRVLLIRKREREIIKKEFSYPYTTFSIKVIRETLYPIIESLSFNGPVEGIAIVPRQTIQSTHNQYTLHKQEEIEESTSDLFNKLSLRVKEENLYTLSFQESHIPEKSSSYICSSFGDERSPSPIHFQQERPSYLFPSPQPITALSLLPLHTPKQIIWNNSLLTVVQGQGPEKIGTEWWNQLDSSAEQEREYFKILDNLGRWLWIYRTIPHHKWFLHGMW